MCALIEAIPNNVLKFVMVLLEKKFCFLNIMKIVASPWSVDNMLQICCSWLFVYVLFFCHHNTILKAKWVSVVKIWFL